MLNTVRNSPCSASLTRATTTDWDSAQAATISFADSYGPLAVPFPAAPLATLSLFDPALGTLTKVTLTLDADTSAGTIAWDNEAPVSTDITLGDEFGHEENGAGIFDYTQLDSQMKRDVFAFLVGLGPFLDGLQLMKLETGDETGDRRR